MRHFERFFGGLYPDKMDEVPKVIIDNIYRYWALSTQEDQFDIPNLPCLLPPWSHMWLEAEPPSTIVEDGIVQKWHRDIVSFGVAAVRREVKEGKGQAVLENDILRSMDFLAQDHVVKSHAYPGENMEMRREEIESALEGGFLPKWIVSLTLNALVKHGKHYTFIGMGEVRLYADDLGKSLPIQPLVISNTDEFDREAAHGIGTLAVPFWYALSLMHCKNTELVMDPPPPLAVQKARRKKGYPDVVYRRVIVNPMHPRNRYPSRESTGHIDYRFHICRGHFKDYRQGNGLFGKYHDLYWWDSFVRGDPEIGRVEKVYEVENEK